LKYKQELEAKLRKEKPPPLEEKVPTKETAGKSSLLSPTSATSEDDDDEQDISQFHEDTDQPENDSIYEGDDGGDDEDENKDEKKKTKAQSDGSQPDMKKGRSVKRNLSGEGSMNFEEFLEGPHKGHRRKPSKGAQQNITEKDGKKVIFSSFSDGSVGHGFVKALIIFDNLKNVVRARVYRIENLQIQGEKADIKIELKITPDSKSTKLKDKRPMKRG